MRGMTQARGTALLAVILTAALVGAGCGDSKDSGGGGDSTQAKGSGIRAGTGTRAETAATAGTAAGEAAGAPVTLDTNKTVGIINFLDGIESADRLRDTTKAALEGLGYKTVLCDGAGDPAKMVACGNSLLDRGVDAIMEDAIDPSLITSVIKKAQAKKVPIVQVGGATSEGLSGSYYPDEAKAGQVLSDYLLKQLATVPDKPADIAVHDFPAPWAKVRTDQLRAAVKNDPDVKITANTQTDSTNLVQGTRKTVADQLTQNPDLKAFWFAFDTAGQAGGPVITAKYPGKEFPDRPLVATFHADVGTTDIMRKGGIDVALDTNYDAAVWVGVDNLLEYWGREKPFDTTPQPAYEGIGDGYSYTVITKDNLPAAGKYVEPEHDVPAYFQAKWKQEFGTP